MDNAADLLNAAGAFGAAGIFVILVLDRVQKLIAKRNGNGITTEKMIQDLYLGRSPAGERFEMLRVQLLGLDRTIKDLACRISLIGRTPRVRPGEKDDAIS